MEEKNFPLSKKILIKKVDEFLLKRNLNPKVEKLTKEELKRFKELNQMDSEY